jgi:uncharacterized membrane protein
VLVKRDCSYWIAVASEVTAQAACVCGASTALALLVADLSHRTLPCTSGSSCQHVLSSRFAHVASIPISGLGLGMYAILIVLQGMRFKGIRPLNRVNVAILALSVLGGLASFGLTAFSVSSLGALCSWCTVSTACFLVNMSANGIRAAMSPSALAYAPGFVRWSIRLTTFMFVLSAAILLAGIESEPSPSYDAVVFGRLAREQLLPSQSPSLVRGASHTKIVVFADISCLSCRRLLFELTDRNIRNKQNVTVYYRVFLKSKTNGNLAINKLALRLTLEGTLHDVLKPLLKEEDLTYIQFAKEAAQLKEPPDAKMDIESALVDDLRVAGILDVKSVPFIYLVNEDGSRKVLRQRELRDLLHLYKV